MTQRERWAVQKRRQRATEGTYAYNDVHGIGDAGLMKRWRQRRWLFKIGDARDTARLVELQNRMKDLVDEINAGIILRRQETI